MSPAADSAGQPFAGRSFNPNPFVGDTGESDTALASALDGFYAGVADTLSVPDTPELARAWVAVVDALRTARLLSPLIAQAGDLGLTESGITVEKTQELSVPHLLGPDGRAVAAIFSHVGALRDWNPHARPIPVEGPKAALAAASDGLELMVLNPGSAGSVVFRRSAIRAVATGADYLPPWADAAIFDAVAAGVAAGGEAIVGHQIVPGDPSQVLAGPELGVLLGVSPGLSESQLDAMTGAVSRSWASNTVLTEACDGLSVKVSAA